ncbi:hypothetical protein FPCIR_6751 [Fusarium pseudocircinatum]|uniref:Uncharacterized protein n=1 Tax=Fusarium pseudocircinatum TaxID=56676 RepID=A0A8H5LEB9_9HYPO|nr:hypothetical protein FPCIR_6751 [Fusarium pseudocircinatum]
MIPNQREIQRQLMKKYNIVFDGPIDSISNPQWPSTCNTVFEHIRQLGRTDYSQYRESISADFTKSPWRYQVQRRAKRITEKAKLCIESRKNESGWRLSLESEVMARFSVEIACRNCRGRLWRSEQEVTAISQSDADDANSLKARQQRRQPCNCKNNGLSPEIQEQGISPLFDDRAEEAIIYSDKLRAELPKREDRPDRVYGLQVTERLSRLLLAAENVRSSPFRQDGDPLVFPFLVIEAKSEKGCDAFTDTQVQTAFAIRELLFIQNQLARVAEEDKDWEAGPLVWFLSYKGEQWRVSAAYIHHHNDKTSYRVLLLIVDYIADWARDIYREGIARSLQKLAALDTQSLARDTDVFSLAGNVREWTCNSPDASEIGTSRPFRDPLSALDCENGYFRDARFVRSTFVGLLITEENFEHFLRTGTSDNESRRLAASLLSSIEDSVRAKGDLLNELELLWTDTDRNLSNISSPDEAPTRELSYVAVSESLIPDLAKIGRLATPSAQVLTGVPRVESLAIFGELLKATPRANVSACISRLCLVTGAISRRKSGKSPSTWAELPLESVESGTTVKEAVVKTCQRPKAREFLYDIYSKHSVGRNEPSTPIFRFSSTMDELADSKELPEDQYSFSKCDWRWKHNVELSLFSHGKRCLFVMSDERSSNELPTICVFVIDSSIARTGLNPLIVISQMSRHTCAALYHKKYGSLKGWNRSKCFPDNGEFRWSLNRTIEFLRITPASPSRHAVTKWDLLTTGWKSEVDTDDSFEFTQERPFRRRPFQGSLRETLLGHKREIGLIPQREIVVLDDDDEPEDSAGDQDSGDLQYRGKKRRIEEVYRVRDRKRALEVYEKCLAYMRLNGGVAPALDAEEILALRVCGLSSIC